MTAGPALALTRLRVGYGRSVVIESVDLTVVAGQVVGLTGANGAGKTTLLRAISGLVPVLGGTIQVAGTPLATGPAKIVRQGIAHVPEGRQCFGALTVLENLRVASYGVGPRLSPGDLALVLDVFPALKRLLDRKAALLSGGEQQMLAIGRGLVAKAGLLLIDELSLGLAPRLVSDLWAALHDVRTRYGTTIVVVDQNLRQLDQQCDHVYLLRRGMLVDVSGRGEDDLTSLYFADGDLSPEQYPEGQPSR